MIPFSCIRAAAAAAALTLCASASAQAPMPNLTGEYNLLSSKTVPPSNWGYSKGRISIKQLDERHLLILLACEWKREPKAVCGDYYYAQWRDNGLYLQDMNTFAMRLYFDPATRKLTIISRGADAKQSVRHEVFGATTEPLVDPALVRRMKRETSNADSKENRRVFGPYTKWDYQENRIEFQRQDLTAP
ncbi:hypothetical protein IGS59_10570 [Janthinobacterium sp. GW460P]|uniref:hypothetical protein n=1 Tax=unclassified Janthinobacterium TaxID=2610881 RepID=UPI000A329A0A|nr:MULTISPECIES: hypothetical protein [unclassified Janthinobacterium]MCC7702685.1 hypothetical protein [Janthinobacterium sp. GW460P]MCC7708193.1 hypothetical protein [Janthinobacterium sp. GW460W]